MFNESHKCWSQFGLLPELQCDQPTRPVWHQNLPKKSHAKSLMTFWQLEFKKNHETKIHKVQRADLTCDVIKKVAPFVLSKL